MFSLELNCFRLFRNTKCPVSTLFDSDFVSIVRSVRWLYKDFFWLSHRDVILSSKSMLFLIISSRCMFSRDFRPLAFLKWAAIAVYWVLTSELAVVALDFSFFAKRSSFSIFINSTILMQSNGNRKSKELVSTFNLKYSLQPGPFYELPLSVHQCAHSAPNFVYCLILYCLQILSFSLSLSRWEFFH